MDEILTVDEVADYMKVNTETIYRWLNAGMLKGTKIGGLWRIKRDDVTNFGQGYKTVK